MAPVRGKILLFCLGATGTLAALLGLAQMWGDIFAWDLFLKIMGTLLVTGAEISFLVAVDYDLPASRKKWLLGALVVLSALTAGLLATQIWAQIFAWPVFLKLLGTLGIVLGLLGFLLVVAEDFGSNKRLRDQNFID